MQRVLTDNGSAYRSHLLAERVVGLWRSARTPKTGDHCDREAPEQFDTSALAMPEQVSIAMEEIAADMHDGSLAIAVDAGLR